MHYLFEQTNREKFNNKDTYIFDHFIKQRADQNKLEIPLGSNSRHAVNLNVLKCLSSSLSISKVNV